MKPVIFVLFVLTACYHQPPPRNYDAEAKAAIEVMSKTYHDALLKNATAVLTELGMTNAEIGYIATNLIASCDKYGGCGELPLKSAPPPSCPETTPDNNAPNADGDRPYWCLDLPGSDSICVRGQRNCEAAKQRYEGKYTGPGKQLGECFYQESVACYRIKNKLSGEEYELCSASLSTCKADRTRANKDDYDVLSECKASK